MTDDRHLSGKLEPPPPLEDSSPPRAHDERTSTTRGRRAVGEDAVEASAVRPSRSEARPPGGAGPGGGGGGAAFGAPPEPAARPYSEVAVADTPQSMASQIIALASNPNLNVETLQALVSMQERMERRQAEIEFTEALATLPPIRVKKNGKVELGPGKGSYPFAKWEDIARIIDPLLSDRGFRLVFDSQPRQADGGGLIVTGTLLHRAGHSRTASMPLSLDSGPGRNNLQAMGSTLSYGKRYCTEMLLNVVREGEDKDGSDADPITDVECAELSRGLTETGLNLNAFLSLFGVTAIPDIQRKDLATARNAINLKRRGRQP